MLEYGGLKSRNMSARNMRIWVSRGVSRKYRNAPLRFSGFPPDRRDIYFARWYRIPVRAAQRRANCRGGTLLGAGAGSALAEMGWPKIVPPPPERRRGCSRRTRWAPSRSACGGQVHGGQYGPGCGLQWADPPARRCRISGGKVRFARVRHCKRAGWRRLLRREPALSGYANGLSMARACFIHSECTCRSYGTELENPHAVAQVSFCHPALSRSRRFFAPTLTALVG